MFNLFIDYITWHYGYALVNILRLMREFVRFFFNLFSISLFLKSLFSPLFSMPVDDVDSEYISDTIATFFGGLIIRLLGAIFRSVLILLGLFLSIVMVVFFAGVFVLWFMLPVIFLVMLYYVIMISFTIV